MHDFKLKKYLFLYVKISFKRKYILEPKKTYLNCFLLIVMTFEDTQYEIIIYIHYIYFLFNIIIFQ